MEYKEFEKIFIEECTKNGIKVNDENLEKFYRYMKELLEWNEKINLTAIKDEKEFIVKHFVDSLTISDLVGDNKRVIDIGTGGGFPGIPLKLNNKNLDMTLVDSVNKKVMVVNDIISKLELKNIEALHKRAEDLAQDSNYRESFDIAVSRAVSNLNTLVEYLIPFVKIGGRIISMKGPGYDEELKLSMKAIEVLGGTIEEVKALNINSDLERYIVVIKKVKSTNKKYPRNQGKPLKEPIR